MYQRIAYFTIVVKDYDEAIEFYVNKLGWKLLEDTQLSDVKRWVIISPNGAKECSVLLAKAANEEQERSVGNQCGGRVSFFLYTDDIDRDYENYLSKGIKFIRPKTEEPFGTVAVFEDLYGNKWDMIQPNEHNKGWIK